MYYDTAIRYSKDCSSELNSCEVGDPVTPPGSPFRTPQKSPGAALAAGRSPAGSPATESPFTSRAAARCSFMPFVRGRAVRQRGVLLDSKLDIPNTSRYDVIVDCRGNFTRLEPVWIRAL